MADDGGHIGWWHPGRLQLRPKRWDERLPLPGTGQAEWRGVLPFKALPKVIDPKQGWLANWNNIPSVGWTNGDASAQETNEGDLHRGKFLQRLVAAAAANPSYDALKGVERVSGVTAQQRPLLDAKLRAAAARASGPAKTVLDTIVAWDGNYDRTDANGTVDPGVAAFEALKARSERSLPPAAVRLLGQRGGSHPFDMGAAETAAMHAASAGDLVGLAGDAAEALAAAVRLGRPGGVARAAQDVRRRGPGRGRQAAAEVLRPRDVHAGGGARAVGQPRSRTPSPGRLAVRAANSRPTAVTV